MIERRQFIRDLVNSYGSTIDLKELDQAQEIRFAREEMTVRITVPDSLDVREYFTDILMGEESIFSDWSDIYKTDNETDEALEEMYREELAEHLGLLVSREFKVVSEGRLFKAKKLEFK